MAMHVYRLIMIGQGLLDLDGLPEHMWKRVAKQTCVGLVRLTAPNRPGGPGSLKQAIIDGRTPLPPQHLTRGHTVGPVRLDYSNVHGLGVFAARTIRAGEYIIAVRGKLLLAETPQSELAEKYTWAPAAGGPYVIEQLDTNVANIARYINSGPDGNVGLYWHCAGKVATFHARKDIAKGEELLCPYQLV